MDKTAIKKKLTTIFRTVFDDDTIVLWDDMTASDIENWDSLSHMLMIGEVEKSFSIKFKLKELGKLGNLGSLIEQIGLKMEK